MSCATSLRGHSTTSVQPALLGTDGAGAPASGYPEETVRDPCGIGPPFKHARTVRQMTHALLPHTAAGALADRLYRMRRDVAAS